MKLATGVEVVVRALVFLVAACGSGAETDPQRWEVAQEQLPGALLSVWGTSATDIWAVGGDPNGTGPTVLRLEDGEWKMLETGTVGDLWWVFGFEGGPIYMGGAGGTILRYKDGAVTKMTTPGQHTVFGIWGASKDDVWAVGGAQGGADGAFAWKLSGDVWVDAPGFPSELAADKALWKVYGRSANDVWLVGTFGLVVHWNGSSFETGDVGVGESLFTVHANNERFTAVGGFGTGIIVENDGSGWKDVAPIGVPAVVGVCSTAEGGYAVGFDGVVLARDANGWNVEETGLRVFETYHAVWVDPSGGVWAAGGKVSSIPLIDGVLVHKVPGGTR